MPTEEDSAKGATERYNAWFVEQVKSPLERHREGSARVHSIEEVRERARLRALENRSA